MSVVYITTQGAYLRKQGGAYSVFKGDELIQSIPRAAVECVVLLGYAQVSTQAVSCLLEDGIPLLYLSQTGRFKGMLQPGYPKNVIRRMAQYEASLDPAFSLNFAKECVCAKLEAALDCLQKWKRNGWGDVQCALRAIPSFVQRAEQASSIPTLRGMEAAAARIYFQAFAHCLPVPFEWNGRSRRPPADPVNALLSFSYMVAVGEAITACFAHGLDPGIGYLHELDYGRPSLSLDLLEPIRPAYCDHLVLRILQAEQILPADFQCTHEFGYRLAPDALPRFMQAYDAFTTGTAGQSTPLRARLRRLAVSTALAIHRKTRPDWRGAGEEAGHGLPRGV